MINYGDDILAYFSNLKKAIENIDIKEINTFINLLLKARAEHKHIFIMGNGGSASTASHYCCDFNKGCICDNENRFKFICLNDNIPSLMAYANDLSYDDVFVEQLKNFFNPGDYVIGISGSGNSRNVLRAIEYAKKNSGITIGITGYDGGKLKKISDFSINVNINDMQISEDMHMILDHLCMKVISTRT